MLGSSASLTAGSAGGDLPGGGDAHVRSWFAIDIIWLSVCIALLSIW